MPRLDFAVVGLLLIAGLAAAFPAAAEQPVNHDAAASQLHDVESAIEEGQKHQAETDQQIEQMSREIAGLREQMIATAKSIQDQEESLSAIDVQLFELNSEADAVTDLLSQRQAEYAAMMAALTRLARNPPEAALLLPAPPLDVVRGAVVLRTALPPLTSGIQSLADQLSKLTALRQKITSEQDEKFTATKNLQQESAHLDALLERMVEAEQRARSDSAETSERLGKLSADAKDLKDLLARIEASRPKQREAAPQTPKLAALEPGPKPGTKNFSAARGSLVSPVRGRIVKNFGRQDGSGVASKGVTFATRADARVVAPYEGRVEFAGPFRGYGQLLIIAQGEGYHILLAGLSRIDCVVGQWLLAGEPVGIMGPAENGDPQLYVELRHDGETINPLPWMSAHNEKVNE